MIKLACCGDDCNYCPRYIGTINNDEDMLNRAAEIWYKMGWRDKILSPDEMKCYGCLFIRNCVYGIKECCGRKKIDNCGYCSEMPCRKLTEALRKIKEFKDISKSTLSEEEFDMLKAAFYMKEEYLNKIKNNSKK